MTVKSADFENLQNRLPLPAKSSGHSGGQQGNKRLRFEDEDIEDDAAVESEAPAAAEAETEAEKPVTALHECLGSFFAPETISDPHHPCKQCKHTTFSKKYTMVTFSTLKHPLCPLCRLPSALSEARSLGSNDSVYVQLQQPKVLALHLKRFEVSSTSNAVVCL